MKKSLAPSLLSANFYNLSTDLSVLKNKGIKYLHLDVMDGIFVPNISFGVPVIKKIKESVKDDFIFDTHLMIMDPIRYVKTFKEAGADILTIHVEATKNVKETIKMIHDEGMKAGISINPETDVKMIDEYLDDADLVLVMSVHPGFGGQKFISDVMTKVKYLKEMKEKNNYKYIIEIDGGINVDNVKSVLDEGCEIVVAGSAVFKNDIASNINNFNVYFN